MFFDEEPLGADLGLASGEVADTTIAAWLDRRVALPATVTVGILHLPGARARTSWYSAGDFADLTQPLADTAIAMLSRSPRVARAIVLPAVIVGEQKTVAGLREAAARLQAHVLLVYRPSCRFYDRTPFIGSTQYRAVCTVESALLDTRSGVVPLTTVVTEEFVTQKRGGDFDVSGTWRRAQLETVTQALVATTRRISDFLLTVPTQPPR